MRLTETFPRSSTNSTWAFRRMAHCLVIGALLVAMPLPVTAARGRSSSSRRARAAAQAQRNRMIAETRRSIEQAKEVLKRAEGQVAASQAELERLSSQLAAGERTYLGASARDADAKLERLKLEERILEAQGDDSDYAKKVDEVEQIQLQLEHEFHHVLKLPENLQDAEDIDHHRLVEMSRLSQEQRDRLHRNPQYHAAEDALIKSCRELTAMENQLFQADSAWVTAHDKELAAEVERRQQERESRRGGAAVRSTGKQLGSMADLAAQARAAIAAGEARLKQLGSK